MPVTQRAGESETRCLLEAKKRGRLVPLSALGITGNFPIAATRIEDVKSQRISVGAHLGDDCFNFANGFAQSIQSIFEST